MRTVTGAVLQNFAGCDHQNDPRELSRLAQQFLDISYDGIT